MINNIKRITKYLLSFLLLFVLFLTGCEGRPKAEPFTGDIWDTAVQETEASNQVTQAEPTEEVGAQTDDKTGSQTAEFSPEEDGSYNSKDEVALYLHTYGRLPKNYITKEEARQLGWAGGSLEEYMPDGAIGGDRFGNYEGLLPEADGRRYFECDIDTWGKTERGAKRMIYSNDGLIYYTDDHYESFAQLYSSVGEK